MRRLLLATLVLLAAAGAEAQTRKNVIIYIGDGYGISPKTATRMALGQGQDGSRFSTDPDFQLLAVDRLPYNTTVTTHSLNSWVTDSAPGATVYAAGQAGKVDNEFIALNPETRQPIETILEAAKREGYAVGIVSTARITHATPASFASHIWNRDLEDYIAAQYVSASQAQYEGVFNASASGEGYDPDVDWVLPAPKAGVKLDVILGGGARHFLPSTSSRIGCPNADTPNALVRDRSGVPVASPDAEEVRISGRRPDCVDLVEVAKGRGYTYVNSRDGLLGVDYDQFAPGNDAALLGLFNASHMLYEQERQVVGSPEPSLTDMTNAAIEVLERKSDKGFFLIVESGRIDHLEHANAGGIQIAGGQYQIDANFEAYFADGVYSGRTPDVPGPVYGSDYMIKEVLGFDYAIEAGRRYLGDRSNGETLIFQTADHECGGFAAVSLNDPSSEGGSRTYAEQPRQDGSTDPSRANPTGITRGGFWFPQYQMREFQGLLYPEAMASGNRIVVSYGSNPVVNGNTTAVGSTPGNHTPSDIFVGAEDNVGGQFAQRITGRGLLDNTDLTPIMESFLGVEAGGTVAVRPPPPVAFGAFDADGRGDPRGEFVVLENTSTAEPAVLSGGAFVVFDPRTERVTYTASPDVVIDEGGALVFATQGGDVALPPNTLPDGPGAFAYVQGDAAVGDAVATFQDRVVAAVVYVNERRVIGRRSGGGGAARTTGLDLVEALRQAAAEAGGPVDLSVTTAPNPTRGRTTVAFGVAERQDVRVAVYDALGREVAVLADGAYEAGRHDVVFDGAAFSAGLYVVRVEGAEGRTAQVTVVR